MKCNIHNKKYIWISEVENIYYCDDCINDMIEEDMYLTSNNWDYLYEYYINELQLENFKGVQIMKDKSFQEITNEWQLFFKDIENGVYGETIKNAFKKEKESSE